MSAWERIKTSSYPLGPLLVPLYCGHTLKPTAMTREPPSSLTMYFKRTTMALCSAFVPLLIHGTRCCSAKSGYWPLVAMTGLLRSGTMRHGTHDRMANNQPLRLVSRLWSQSRVRMILTHPSCCSLLLRLEIRNEGRDIFRGFGRYVAFPALKVLLTVLY